MSFHQKKEKSQPVVPSKMEMIKLARTKLGMDIEKFYNIAVIGNVDAGKSTLINVMRRLPDAEIQSKDNHGSAAVGNDVTTMEIKPYYFADNEHSSIVLWDVPGTGVLSHRSATYFQDNVLYAFDCLILLTKDTLTESDYNLTEKALEWHIPIVLAYSRADETLKNVLRLKKEQGLVHTEDDKKKVFENAIADIKGRTFSKLPQDLKIIFGALNQSINVISSISFRKFLANPQGSKVLHELLAKETTDFSNMVLLKAMERRLAANPANQLQSQKSQQQQNPGGIVEETNRFVKAISSPNQSNVNTNNSITTSPSSDQPNASSTTDSKK